jgi:type IX secretion system PorP/SprF family membrane protein
MKTFKYVWFLLLLTLSAIGFSQEQPTMLFFTENAPFYNPAFTGTYGQVATVNNRTQWAGVTDAPVLQSFSYQRDFKNRAAWGVSFQNDKVFIEKQGVLAVDYNYKLDLSENSQLYLGLKGGAYFKSIDKARLNRLTNSSNNALDAVRNYSNPLLGVGVHLDTKYFFLSAGVPNLLNSKRYKESEGLVTTATDRPNLYLSTGVTLGLTKSLALKPAILYRGVSDAPNFYNLQLMLELKDKVGVGLSKMNNDYFGAMFIFKGMSFLDLGYAYEFSNRSSNIALKENNHELFVRFKFSNTSKQTASLDSTQSF